MNGNHDDFIKGKEIAESIWKTLTESVNRQEIHMSTIGAILESVCISYFRQWSDPQMPLDFLYNGIRLRLVAKSKALEGKE